MRILSALTPRRENQLGREDLADDGGAGDRSVAQRIEINLSDAAGLAVAVEVERAAEEITEIGASEGNTHSGTGGKIFLVEKGDSLAVTREFAAC